MTFFDKLYQHITTGAATIRVQETGVDRYYKALYVADELDRYEIEYWDGLPATIRHLASEQAMTRSDERPPWVEGGR